MSLWNLIRDFFVENIFGGVLSDGNHIYGNVVGDFYSLDSSGNIDEILTESSVDYALKVDGFSSSHGQLSPLYISVGDWLSTTFTIITLILLVIFLYIFVKWIFKLFSGLLH